MLGIAELMVEAMTDAKVRVNSVTLVRRAKVNRSALTHRNADIYQAFKVMRGPLLQHTVDKLRTDRDNKQLKLDEANQEIENLRADADLSARVIRALELKLDSVTRDGVTGIDSYRAKKRLQGRAPDDA